MSEEPDAAGADDAIEAPPEPDEVSDLRLEAPEDHHTLSDWEAATAAVLRKARRLGDEDPDAAVWDRLTRTTLDGLALRPLGTPALLEDLQTSGRPARGGDWDVRTRVADNASALADLDTGATSLWLRVSSDTDLADALDGVLLDLAPVVLDATDEPAALAEAFTSYAADRELHPATNLGGLDPAIARTARGLGILGGLVDATGVHEQGASDVQELGWALARAAVFLRDAEAAGLGVDDAAAALEFRLAATDEQFVTIAKFRAARRLWDRVLELSGAAPAPMRIHAVTSRAMAGKYDPWVNMLRGTVAAFAAGVGGADAVTVTPFDEPLGAPDAFGRRIARNTSALLLLESHVGKVDDPAGGAYAVERLTDDLAVAAWAELGLIESDGADAFDERVAAVVAERDKEVARRTRPLTGISEFPNLAETLPSRPADPTASPVRRYGAAYEALRDEPVATPVFLATMGSVAAHTARATFVTNLLAAGGIAVEAAGPTTAVADVVSAYDVSSPVACLAGPDAAYAEWGADLIAALREAGAQRVILAGRPGELDVDDSAALGDDALAFLSRTREALA